MVKLAALFACALLLVSPVRAQDAPDPVAEIVQHSQRAVATPPADAEQFAAQAAALARAARTNPEIAGMLEQARQHTTGALHGAQTPAGPGEGRNDEQGVRFRIFISQSMPLADIDAALASAQANPDAAVLLRGSKEGQKLGEVFRFIRARIASLKGRAPLVDLDPTRFTQAGITVVPSVVAYANDRPIAVLHGSTNPARLKDKLDAGQHGDLGKDGPTVAVIEQDFVEFLKARAAAVDEQALKKRSMDAFWAKREFADIPMAQQTREYTFDPTFVVNRDVATPGGTVLAHAGDKINPLDRKPFTQRLVIFDATQKRQVDAIRKWANAKDKRPLLLSTRLDRGRAGQELEDLRVDLRSPVYLLSPQIEAQFHVQHVPCVIEADGRVFRVREIAPAATTEDETDAGTHAAPR